MIDKNHPGPSVSEQAGLLNINRTSLYYKPVQPNKRDLEIKCHIDKIYTAHPEIGPRRICEWLKRYDGIHLNRKTIQRHMREMGIEAIYPHQKTSNPSKDNPIYPYLLKGLVINHLNQVWSTGITYILVRTSWLYLAAIIDWYSRYVTDWMIDDTLAIGFILETSKRALKKAVPDIMNSGQRSHFTSSKYTQIFLDTGCKISMDHRGKAYDNIFISKVWQF